MLAITKKLLFQRSSKTLASSQEQETQRHPKQQQQKKKKKRQKKAKSRYTDEFNFPSTGTATTTCSDGVVEQDISEVGSNTIVGGWLRTKSSSGEETAPACDELLLTSEEIKAAKKSLDEAPGDAPVGLIQARMKVVRMFTEAFNAHDLETALGMTNFDMRFQFMDRVKNVQMEMTWEEFSAAQQGLNASFPDFCFEHDDRHVVEKCGVVVMQGVRVAGTHTGKPFGFGPFEPIEASGKFVQNDPEELYYIFEEGTATIAKLVVCAKGEMTGPAGIYTQLGGFPLM